MRRARASLLNRSSSRVCTLLLSSRGCSLVLFVALFLCILYVIPGGSLSTKARGLAFALSPPCVPAGAPFLDANASGGTPSFISACLTFNDRPRAWLPEWVAFHRAQGINRFDIAWDVVRAEPLNATRVREFDDAVRPWAERGVARGLDLEAFGARAANIEFAASRAREMAGASACAPSPDDVATMKRFVSACIGARGGWGCQVALHALCLTAAQVRGDSWIGFFDADEFIFAPAGNARCFYGGRPSDEDVGSTRGANVDSLRGTREASADACTIPLERAPLLSGRSVAAVLRGMHGWSSVFVKGAAFGPLREHRPEGALVTDMHRRSAKYSAGFGFQVGVPAKGWGGAACPEWFCGMASPQKSFVRVQGAPVDGLRVHAHDVGLQRLVFNAPGAPLKLNHYAFDDFAAAAEKARTRSVYGAISDNRDGLADYLNAWPDESARALIKITAHCMQSRNFDDPACAPAALSRD